MFLYFHNSFFWFCFMFAFFANVILEGKIVLLAFYVLVLFILP